MAAKVATSVVTSGPDDKLVAVDAYSPTPSAAGDEPLSRPSTVANNAAEIAQGTSIKVADIGNMIEFKDGSFGLDRGVMEETLKKNAAKGVVSGGDAGKRIDKAAGQSLTSFGLDKDTKVLAEALFPGILESDSVALLDDAGKAYDIIDKAKADQAAGLADAIQKLTGVETIGNLVDNTAGLATACSYLDKAIALGVPNLIDDIINKYERDKNTLNRLLNSVPSVVFRSDLPTLNKIMDHIGPEGVLAQMPDACTVLVGVYRFITKTVPADYPARYTELVNTLKRIDPTWDQIMRNGVMVSNLAPFTRMSSTAKMLFTMNEEYIVPVMVAPSYLPIDLYALAKRYFPEMRAW